ncbi:hypothetical protein [Noviherbaspirillum aridicola]|uniref:Uncharacterized protein n=1 Tax=Noviherbaspirillum aridicola TaxID=2849687 RepID=A0ABQ4Q929_9BURK|nr:hypothetical protein [Noviherbaspirillum aridicola]GIZ53700.1 hypothetical protein NCCP691_37140 [Noviherbaspirillum aridicola]
MSALKQLFGIASFATSTRRPGISNADAGITEIKSIVDEVKLTDTLDQTTESAQRSSEQPLDGAES